MHAIRWLQSGANTTMCDHERPRDCIERERGICWLLLLLTIICQILAHMFARGIPTYYKDGQSQWVGSST